MAGPCDLDWEYNGVLCFDEIAFLCRFPWEKHPSCSRGSSYRRATVTLLLIAFVSLFGGVVKMPLPQARSWQSVWVADSRTLARGAFSVYDRFCWCAVFAAGHRYHLNADVGKSDDSLSRATPRPQTSENFRGDWRSLLFGVRHFGNAIRNHRRRVVFRGRSKKIQNKSTKKLTKKGTSRTHWLIILGTVLLTYCYCYLLLISYNCLVVTFTSYNYFFYFANLLFPLIFFFNL